MPTEKEVNRGVNPTPTTDMHLAVRTSASVPAPILLTLLTVLLTVAPRSVHAQPEPPMPSPSSNNSDLAYIGYLFIPVGLSSWQAPLYTSAVAHGSYSRCAGYRDVSCVLQLLLRLQRPSPRCRATVRRTSRHSARARTGARSHCPSASSTSTYQGRHPGCWCRI